MAKDKPGSGVSTRAGSVKSRQYASSSSSLSSPASSSVSRPSSSSSSLRKRSREVSEYDDDIPVHIPIDLHSTQRITRHHIGHNSNHHHDHHSSSYQSPSRAPSHSHSHSHSQSQPESSTVLSTRSKSKPDQKFGSESKSKSKSKSGPEEDDRGSRGAAADQQPSRTRARRSGIIHNISKNEQKKVEEEDEEVADVESPPDQMSHSEGEEDEVQDEDDDEQAEGEEEEESEAKNEWQEEEEEDDEDAGDDSGDEDYEDEEDEEDDEYGGEDDVEDDAMQSGYSSDEARSRRSSSKSKKRAQPATSPVSGSKKSKTSSKPPPRNQKSPASIAGGKSSVRPSRLGAASSKSSKSAMSVRLATLDPDSVVCPRCHNSFTTHQHLKTHFNRKVPCDPDHPNIRTGKAKSIKHTPVKPKVAPAAKHSSPLMTPNNKTPKRNDSNIHDAHPTHLTPTHRPQIAPGISLGPGIGLSLGRGIGFARKNTLPKDKSERGDQDSSPGSGSSDSSGSGSGSGSGSDESDAHSEGDAGSDQIDAKNFHFDVVSTSDENLRIKLSKKSDETADETVVESNADDNVCRANDVIIFKLVRTPSDVLTDSSSFSPTYTHQVFQDEEIAGYKNLKVHLFFTANSLYTYMDVTYDSKTPNADSVFEPLADKLQKGFSTDLEEFKKHIDEPFTPPGTMVCEYTIPSVDINPRDKITYQIYHGTFDTPGMRDFHERLQFFLLFFIDRSSYINDQDPIWEILLLFEKRQTKNVTVYNIVGYTTLYKFLSYPSSWRLRISQIMILTPYQRAGHGQKLLQYVYQIAQQLNFSEVNVEDPAPVFQFLRDLTDAINCRKEGFFQKQGHELMASSLEVWSDEYAREVAKALRITLHQVRRCFEIFKLASVDMKNEKQYQGYRLEVKKRLYAERNELLSVECRTPDEVKAKLQEYYSELEHSYLNIIRKARIHK